MICAIFESLTAVLLKIQAFWDVSLDRMVYGHRCCEGTSCIHLQGFSIRWTVEGCLFLVNVVEYLPNDTAWHLRRYELVTVEDTKAGDYYVVVVVANMMKMHKVVVSAMNMKLSMVMMAKKSVRYNVD